MSEVRLIDANALKKYVDGCEFCNNCQNKKNRCAFDCILPDYLTSEWERVIDEQPTVDAVPVRHGHWEIVPNDKNMDGYYKMRCSVCGETLWSIQSEELYCCKCGSKMDGADGERR